MALRFMRHDDARHKFEEAVAQMRIPCRTVLKALVGSQDLMHCSDADLVEEILIGEGFEYHTKASTFGPAAWRLRRAMAARARSAKS